MTVLAGRVAVVTGAQQGIGAAIALAAAEAGASVVVNYLDDEGAAAGVVASTQAAGANAVAVQADIAEPREVERLMAAADEFGGVDILVNNAAVFPRTGFLDMTEADWDGVLSVNLRGPFLCSSAAAQRMAAAGREGAIVNLASGAAFRSSPRGAHYVASKAGLVGLTRATALELAPHGIRVNAIAPGLADTAQPRYGMTEDEIAEAADLIPLKGLTLPEDVADLAVFLASAAARRITGQTIHINGGNYLT